jgi:predicted RNA binding protein YcfA (HicA-like mRNA interferase family)
VLSASQVCRILKKHGFVLVGQTGSHIIMRRQLADRGITVPVPNHSEMARGTLKSIIDQSEIPKTEFM